jgi:outer membrane protein TolC
MPTSFGSIPAQFGVPWQASAGFTVQQLLFQADVFVGLKARKTAMDYASANIRVGEDKIRENVLNAYYAVLVAQKQQYFVNESKKRLEKLLHDITEMYKNGFVEKLDIEKTQVSLNNLTTTKAQLDNLLQIGYGNLKLQMGIPQADTLELTTPLSPSEVKEEILSDESFRYEDRNEILALNKVKKLLELDIQRNQLGRIPTIAAYWNYSRNALRQDFNFFKSGAAYPWFPTSIVGVNINVPIFSGFARDQKTKQAKIALEKHNNTISTVQQSIDLQKLAAKKNLITNVEQMDAAEKNMQLAQNVYNTTKKKYEQGIGSSFEVLTADTELQTAQGNYFSALYNAVLAKIAYMRALGKLN